MTGCLTGPGSESRAGFGSAASSPSSSPHLLPPPAPVLSQRSQRLCEALESIQLLPPQRHYHHRRHPPHAVRDECAMTCVSHLGADGTLLPHGPAGV